MSSLGSGPSKRSPNVASGVNALRRTTAPGGNQPKIAAKLPQPSTTRISLKGPSNKPMPLGAYGMLRPENEGLNDLPPGGWGSGSSTVNHSNSSSSSTNPSDTMTTDNNNGAPRSNSTSPALGPTSSYSGNLPIPSMLPSTSGEWFDEVSKTENSLRNKLNNSSNFSSSTWQSSSTSTTTTTTATASAPIPNYTHPSSPPNPTRPMGTGSNDNRRFDDNNNNNNRFNPSTSPLMHNNNPSNNQFDRYRNDNSRNYYGNNNSGNNNMNNGPWRNAQDWTNIRDMGGNNNYNDSSFRRNSTEDNRGRSTERSNELNTTNASSITNRSSTERGRAGSTEDPHARLVATRIVGGASTRIVTPSKPTVPGTFNKSMENLSESEIEQLRRQEAAAQIAALEAERLASEAEIRAEQERVSAEQRERDRIKALEYQEQEMRRRSERQRQQQGNTGSNQSTQHSHHQTQQHQTVVVQYGNEEEEHNNRRGPSSQMNQRMNNSTNNRSSVNNSNNNNNNNNNAIVTDEGTTSIKILARPSTNTTSNQNAPKQPRPKSLFNPSTGEYEAVDEQTSRQSAKVETTEMKPSTSGKQILSRTGHATKETEYPENISTITSTVAKAVTTVTSNSNNVPVKNVWEEKRRATQAAAEAHNQAASETQAQIAAEVRAQKQHQQHQTEAREAEERAERARKQEEAKIARKAARAHEKATRGPRTRGALFQYNAATNEIVEIEPATTMVDGSSGMVDGKDLNTSKSSLGFQSSSVNLLPVLSNPASSLDYGSRRRSTDMKQTDHDSGLPLQSLLLGTLMDEVEGNNDMNTSNLGFQMLNTFGGDGETTVNNTNKDMANRGMKDIIARNPGLVGTSGNIMMGEGNTNPNMLPNSSIISFSAIPGAMAPPNPVSMDMAQIFAQQQDPNLQPRNILQLQQPNPTQSQGNPQQIPQQQMYNFANYFYNVIPGTNMIQGQEQMMAAMGIPPNVQLFHPAYPAFSTGGSGNAGNPGMELIRGPPMTSFPMQPPTGHFTLQPATLQPAQHRNLIPATVMIDNGNPNANPTVSALNPSASLWQPSTALPSDPWMARHTVPAPTWGSGVLGMGMMGIPNSNGPNTNNGSPNPNPPSQSQPNVHNNDNRVWSSFGQADGNNGDNVNNNMNNGNNNSTSSFLKPAAAVETGGGLKLIPTSMVVPNSSSINTTSFWQQQQQAQQQANMFNPIMAAVDQSQHLGLKFQNMSLLDDNDMNGNVGYDMNNYNYNNVRGGMRGGGMNGNRGGGRGGNSNPSRNFPNEYDDRQAQQSMRGGRGGNSMNVSSRGGGNNNTRGGYRPSSAGGSPSKM